VVLKVQISIIGAFIRVMLEQDPKWIASVTSNSPYDVRLFITKKCASPSEGGEGKKVCLSTHFWIAPINSEIVTQFPTAVSIWAALTYFYRSSYILLQVTPTR
jgi:hypothetical protein